MACRDSLPAGVFPSAAIEFRLGVSIVRPRFEKSLPDFGGLVKQSGIAERDGSIE
jgi:hypothetical protein